MARKVKMTLFNYLAEHFRIVACDSEFQPVAGEMPNVLCFVFKDIVKAKRILKRCLLIGAVHY